MKHLKLILFVLLLASTSLAQRNFAGKVVEIVDGKTVVIEITGGGRMTAALQYVEVPEADQPLADIVRNHLRDLVYGQVVEFRGQGIGTGTIITGKLSLGEVDVSQQMIRDGAAWHVPAAVSGQESNQNASYAENETMAKGQKLGIWSVPGMKPAWDHRAEKAEAQRQKELAMKPVPAPEAQPVSTPNPMFFKVKKRYTPEDQTRAYANMPFWPDVGPSRRDAVTGLSKSYDMAKQMGIVETGSAMLNMAGSNGAQRKIEARSFYIYFGNEGNVNNGSYGIGFVSSAAKQVFQKTTGVTIIADGKKITLKPVTYVPKKPGGDGTELLLYKLDEESMQNIAYADKLEVVLAGYSAKVDDEARNTMRVLMLARR